MEASHLLRVTHSADCALLLMPSKSAGRQVNRPTPLWGASTDCVAAHHYLPGSTALLLGRDWDVEESCL